MGASACGLALLMTCASSKAAEEPAHPASLDEAIIRSAARHGIPESLVRRVVMRESKYNPHARNHKFWGLMQISYPTAKSMGFRGTPQELLNPIVNLRYAVPYLANAFVVAGKRQDAAIRLYAHGYYEAAKQRGLLGVLRTADSTPLVAVPDEAELAAAAPPYPVQEPGGIFGARFGPSEMPRDAATEQAVYASAQQPQAADPVQPVSSAAPAGHDDNDVAMVADKRGALHPPKSWQRDGGTTVIARGEQSVEKIAAYAKSADASDDHRRRRSHKTSLFASLDAPPAGAQAYAATAGGEDPRMLQTESQAAIAQATSAQPAGTSGADVQPSASPAPAPAAAADDEPAKKKHARRTARRSHHHEAPEAPATAMAAAPVAAPAEAPASADPAASQAVAGQEPTAPPQAEAAGPTPAEQAGPDTSVASDPRAAQGPQDQTKVASDLSDGTSSKAHRHRIRHARARKPTDVAARTSSEGRSVGTQAGQPSQ